MRDCTSYSYEVPANFDRRVKQLLSQYNSREDLAEALSRCHYEIEDLGNAYRNANMRGDNWDMNAVDIIIEGPKSAITALRSCSKATEDAMSKGLRRNESGLLVNNILFLDSDEPTAIPNSDEDRLKTDLTFARSFLADLEQIGSSMCSNITYGINSPENSINDYFRDQLRAMGYEDVRDQTRHGKSPRGLDAGEVDLLVAKDGREAAIVEALKLSSVAHKSIEDHTRKVTSNYNPLGTPAFVIAYACSSDFEGWWSRYISFIRSNPAQVEIVSEITVCQAPNASTRVAAFRISRDGYEFPLYYIAFKLIS